MQNFHSVKDKQVFQYILHGFIFKIKQIQKIYNVLFEKGFTSFKRLNHEINIFWKCKTTFSEKFTVTGFWKLKKYNFQFEKVRKVKTNYLLKEKVFKEVAAKGKLLKTRLT